MAFTRSSFTIGVLAAQAGCSVPTVRYYEQIGLLPAAGRAASGHRVYGQQDLERLTFVRRCREFQFPIEQIRDLVGLTDDPSRDCNAAKDLADRHLAVVRQKLDSLRLLESELVGFSSGCAARCAGGPARDCIILDNLSAPGNCC